MILSGTNGAVYATLPKATKAYFDYINDTQGGVCGRKIVYKYEDNFDDGARGLETVRRLVEQDKVFAMVGSLSDVAHPGHLGVPERERGARCLRVRRRRPLRRRPLAATPGPSR